MRKRNFLGAAVLGSLNCAASFQTTANAKGHASPAAGPTLLTVTGLIGAPNRGPFDPTFDQMMAKQKINFDKGRTFDFSALAALPSVSIHPTLEYDARPHALKGPLLTTVLKPCGVDAGAPVMLFLRAVDGYAARISLAEAASLRFIVATHLDDRPMALGGIGPLWALCDADRIPEKASLPLAERFAGCPWALYHIGVEAA